MRLDRPFPLRPAAACLLALVGLALAAEVPPPQSVLGFQPGDDFQLASWSQVVEYCRRVDAASDRVVVQDLGPTTQGRPLIVATVSDEATIADLGRFRDLQRRLADPRLGPGPSGLDPVRDSKPVVLITCSIHASEPASTLMALKLLHGLASGSDPATSEILANTILLLVPSANPDGVDIVRDWYEASKGKPWEGSGLPRLYHPYAGHDTNRDWFMLNLVETQHLTRLLYRDWFPTLCYDVHQMGSKGARIFVPPFHDPINPNMDPRLSQSIALIGAHMAADLARARKKGVLTHAIFDNWWNGGNRTTPQRHNMVAVLTEVASAKLASPIFLEPSDLKGEARGFRDHQPAVNFVEPWPGGWWRLRDIIDYEMICARSLLTLAARYRREFQEQYQAMGRSAIQSGTREPPYGWIVPAGQDDPGRAAHLVDVLHRTGIDVYQLPEAIDLDGKSIPAGSWLLPAAQPYRAHLKDMMERQVYPARFTATGAAEPPYDVSGWTLPLQMGVQAHSLGELPTISGAPLKEVKPPRGGLDGEPAPGSVLLLEGRANDEFRLLWTLLDEGARAGKVHWGDPIEVEATDRVVRTARTMLEPLGARVRVGKRSPDWRLAVRRPRVGLYQPWVPSMDEGWTRLVLERHGIPYRTLHNAEASSDDLRAALDVLILPSVDVRTLREGYRPNETDPEFVGGLGRQGARSIQHFVEAGGTLVCLEESCHWAIAELDLPVTEVLRPLRSSEFFGPGSIVRLARGDEGIDSPAAALWRGRLAECPAYFDRSLAFEVPSDPDGRVRIVARYAANDLLESGWLHGPERLQRRAALLVVQVGAGRVVLFGFPPQHRGQTHGTFSLLFQALLLGGTVPIAEVPNR